jgi:hypothetical protein
MKKLMILAMVPCLLVACGGGDGGVDYAEPEAPAVVLIEVQAPDPIPVPEAKPVAGDDDWEARAYNKNIEIIGVLNIINPVATYIVAGFDQYGSNFSEVLQEEWADTQVQLTAATTLYDSCKQRMAAGEYDKKLFLDLGEVWQLLVKTGVAGIRTKSMVDAEVGNLKG